MCFVVRRYTIFIIVCAFCRKGRPIVCCSIILNTPIMIIIPANIDANVRPHYGNSSCVCIFYRLLVPKLFVRD